MTNPHLSSRVDTGSYQHLGPTNPLFILFGSALCYIVSGVMVLVVGVIITSLTFQNLEAYHQGNKERYAGPVLIGAGVLVLARGAIFKLREERGRSNVRRRRSWFRRASDTCEYPDGSSSVYLTPEATATEDLSFGDEPPPYEVVTSAESRYPRTCTIRQQVPCVTRDLDGGITNPALDTTEENEGVAQPPPSYEEVVHMQQTTL